MLSSVKHSRSTLRLIGVLCIVAGLTLSAASAATAAPQWYGGMTTQNLPIVVKLSNTEMNLAAYKARFTCTKTGQVPVTAVEVTTLPSAPIVHSRIDEKFRLLNGTDFALLMASATNGSLIGEFREAYVSKQGFICDSGNVYFKAVRH
jgi:hypothetical protein